MFTDVKHPYSFRYEKENQRSVECRTRNLLSAYLGSIIYHFFIQFQLCSLLGHIFRGRYPIFAVNNIGADQTAHPRCLILEYTYVWFICTIGSDCFMDDYIESY